MREVNAKDITDLVEKLCIDSNYNLPEETVECLKKRAEEDRSPLGRDILKTIVKNAEIAKNESCPMCQDTGFTVIFIRMGQDVHVTGGYIEDAVNEGVRRGYDKGYLRKSVVKHPLNRVNTNDNTPAVIHYEIVPGDEFTITVAPKGFGSENMSQLRMLKPSQGVEGVKEFVINAVSEAGSNPCPPIVVGVGIGGTMEKSAIMSKKAIMRPVGSVNEDPDMAELEAELLESINKLGIGPAGFGGDTTALAVHIVTYPTHIAGLPVAVNILCHATREAVGSL